MHRFKILYCLIIAGLFLSCGQRTSGKEFNFERLIGKWIFKTENALQFEEWQQISPDLYKGRGYVIEGGDTTFFESLEIAKVDGVWNYSAKVASANNDQAIPFALGKQSGDKLEFRNATHDFPKKIGYEFISENELQAYIEGPRDGQTIRILFDFSRCE
ncbi:MAG: DUF6265 family protein [Flavobacteriales bacterium]|jgi:hypothetical protein